MAQFPAGLMGYLQGQQMVRNADYDQTRQNIAGVGILAHLQDMQLQKQQMESVNAIKGIMAGPGTIEEKLPQLLKVPGGDRIAAGLVQLQQHQAGLDETKRQQAFFSPQNQAQFMVGGKPAETMATGGAFNPEENAPAVAPRFNLRGMAEAGVMQGIKGAEPLLNNLAAREQSRAQLAQTYQLAQDRLQNQIDMARQRGEDQKTILQMQIDARKELANLASGLRQPQPLVSIIGPDGKPVLVPREQAVGKTPASAEKAPNDTQSLSALYGSRMAQADKILNDLTGKVNLTGLAAAQNTPLGNVAMSEDMQMMDQAQRNFLNAVLRKESGAVINPSEFVEARKQYFPVMGDTPGNIEQKKKNRTLAINQFKRMAGPAASDIVAQETEPNTAEAQTVEFEGYKFPSQDALDRYKKATGKK